jgi:heptosyltransferase-2
LTHPRVVNANSRPPERYDRHVTEFLLEPLAEILDVSSPPFPAVPIGENEAKTARNFLRANRIDTSSPLIAVHPGSGGRKKVTPANKLGTAVIRILERFPQGKVLIIEGEADAQHVADFEGQLKAPYVKINRENLVDVAGILSRASLFLGNDSGIAHLAAAVGVPTIVVFRASNPTVWAPKGKNVWVASESSLQHVVDKVAEAILNSRE